MWSVRTEGNLVATASHGVRIMELVMESGSWSQVIHELLKETDTNLVWSPAPASAIAPCMPKVLLRESFPVDPVPVCSHQVH